MELSSPLISWVNPFPSRFRIFFCNALESHKCAFCVLSLLYFREKPPQGTALFINLLGQALTPRACMGNGGFSWWTPDISCFGSWTCWPKNIIWYAAVPSCSLCCLYRKDSIPNRFIDLFSSQRKEVFYFVRRLGRRVWERGWNIGQHLSRQPLTLLTVTVLLYLCNLDWLLLQNPSLSYRTDTQWSICDWKARFWWFDGDCYLLQTKCFILYPKQEPRYPGRFIPRNVICSLWWLHCMWHQAALSISYRHRAVVRFLLALSRQMDNVSLSVL